MVVLLNTCKNEEYLIKNEGARVLTNCSFTGITHISEKDFQMLLTLKEGLT